MDLAREIANAVMLKFHLKYEELSTTVESPRKYIVTSVRNAVCDYERSLKTRITENVDQEFWDKNKFEDIFKSEKEHWDDYQQVRELVQEIREFVLTLSPTHIITFILFFELFWSPMQVAEFLEISNKNASTKKRRLLDLIEERFSGKP